MKGEGRESKASWFNNGGEREKEATAQGGRRGPFIGPPRKLAIARHLPWSLRPQVFDHESQSLRTHYRGVHHSKNCDGRSLRTLGPESPDPRAGVSGQAKLPGGSGPKLQMKMAKKHFGPKSPALGGRSLWPWKRQKQLKPKRL
jgi:hypothetical protein